MQRILIVEDDENLREEVKIFLNHNGYEAECLECFHHTVQDILERKPDLVLLDINLPEINGEYICKEIRKQSNMPIMMITSRNNDLDEILCLNDGADQYVTKPFQIQTLLAKISSLLRRSNAMSMNEKMDCKEFILNLGKSTIEKDGKEIALTKNEFKILKYLAEHREQIVSRDDMMDYLWDSESFIDDNTLTVNVTRLRNKLEEIGLKEKLETKRGQGYVLM